MIWNNNISQFTSYAQITAMQTMNMNFGPPCPVYLNKKLRRKSLVNVFRALFNVHVHIYQKKI